MSIFVTFDANGALTGCYPEDVFRPVLTYGQAPEPTEENPQPVAPVIGETRNPAIPADAVEVTVEQHADLVEHQGLRRWNGSALVAYTPPVPPQVTRVQKLDIWRRATDNEAEALVQLLGSQPIRLQRMFNDATVISSADEMWPLLLGGITQLLGSERAAALLAPS